VVALFRQTGDEANQAVALRNLGLAYAESGAAEKALTITQSALKLAETVGDRRLQLLTRGDIAFQHNARGEYAAAIDAYQRTLDDLRATPNPLAESVAWVNLGVAYSQLGDVAEASRAYAKAETAATAADCWSCWPRSPPTKAIPCPTTTGPRKRPSPIGARSTSRRTTNCCASTPKRCADSVAARWQRATGPVRARCSNRAHGELHRTHGLVNEAVVESMLGDLESRQGHLDAARQHYTRTRALARQAANQPWQTVAHASLARIAAQAGDLDGAKRDIERAIASIESERERINAPDLRTSYFGTMRAYYELYVDILMRLDARHPGQAYAANRVDRRRARARTCAAGPADRTRDRPGQGHRSDLARGRARRGGPAARPRLPPGSGARRRCSRRRAGRYRRSQSPARRSPRPHSRGESALRRSDPSDAAASG